RRDDASRLELVVEADALEQFQGRGMVRSRARHLFEEIVLAQRFDQADLHARLRHCEQQTQPHRSGADDDHAFGGAAVHLGVVERATLRPPLTAGGGRACRKTARLARSQLFAATTSLTAPTQPVWVRSNTMPSGPLYLAS